MRRKMYSVLSTNILCIGLFAGAAASAHAFPMTSLQDSTQANGENSQSMDQGRMHHGPMSPDQELSHLTKALDLSSDQQSQLKPVLQDRHDQLMQIHQDASISRQDKMTKMKTLDNDSNTKVEAILNSEQKTKYEKMIADRKERMAQMRAMRHNGGATTQPQ